MKDLVVETVGLQDAVLRGYPEMFCKSGDDADVASGEAEYGLPVVAYGIQLGFRVCGFQGFDQCVTAQGHVLKFIDKNVFDGFGSITAAFTPVRIVCHNTLNAAIRSKQNSFKIRHTSSAIDRLKQAHQLMGITHQAAIDLEQIFNHWAKIRVTDVELHRLISQAMAPSKEVLMSLNEEKNHELSSHFIGITNDVYEYALSAPSQLQSTTEGTLFGLYNAVTGYFQNVRKFSDHNHKLKSIISGTALQRAQSAFDLCLTFKN